jgi:hypothetical protein
MVIVIGTLTIFLSGLALTYSKRNFKKNVEAVEA